MSDALDMIREWLESHGKDGLVNSFSGCGCSKDDLAPCVDGLGSNCVAAYRRTDPPPDDRDFEWEPGDDWWSVDAGPAREVKP